MTVKQQEDIKVNASRNKQRFPADFDQMNMILRTTVSLADRWAVYTSCAEKRGNDGRSRLNKRERTMLLFLETKALWDIHQNLDREKVRPMAIPSKEKLTDVLINTYSKADALFRDSDGFSKHAAELYESLTPRIEEIVCANQPTIGEVVDAVLSEPGNIVIDYSEIEKIISRHQSTLSLIERIQFNKGKIRKATWQKAISVLTELAINEVIRNNSRYNTPSVRNGIGLLVRVMVGRKVSAKVGSQEKFYNAIPTHSYTFLKYINYCASNKLAIKDFPYYGFDLAKGEIRSRCAAREYSNYREMEKTIKELVSKLPKGYVTPVTLHMHTDGIQREASVQGFVGLTNDHVNLVLDKSGLKGPERRNLLELFSKYYSNLFRVDATLRHNALPEPRYYVSAQW